MLREGAVAVLGPQVAVDVVHNAQLMARFFINILEYMSRPGRVWSLLDIWHQVQRSNAIFDVANGNESLQSWLLTRDTIGRSPLQEFMAIRSTGQLRGGSVYSDTERILGEIADDRGMGQNVRNWLRQPGYVPECLFYMFMGRPESIFLNPLADSEFGGWRLTRH
jgi:hypothetical protein